MQSTTIVMTNRFNIYCMVSFATRVDLQTLIKFNKQQPLTSDRSTRDFFTQSTYEDVIITDEGLQILTYVRHSRPLSSEGSILCHTQIRHRPTVYNGHLREPVTLTPVSEHLAVKLSLPVFYDLGLSRPGIEPRSSACEANVLPLRNRGGLLCHSRCGALKNPNVQWP